jgi:hypothetical protein
VLSQQWPAFAVVLIKPHIEHRHCVLIQQLEEAPDTMHII